jgi:hypothetical protein
VTRIKGGLTALACVCAAAQISAQQHQEHAAAAGKNDDALIRSAMSAAPAAVAKDATIIDMANGKVRTVRKGSGNFTCLADSPDTPGPDPMCADQNAMEWVQAWLGKKQPPAKVGVMYMLAGGTDASNTDPYAQKPSATNNWIKTGPHLMIVGAKSLTDMYPKAPKPDTSKPYVMWAGTPYEHLMVPVK